MKKKQKRNIIFAIVAIAAVSSVIGYNYYIDTIKIKGNIFGNELQNIQEELKQIGEDFETHKIMYENGDISKQEFIEFIKNNIQEMESVLEKYETLDIPPPFISSVQFFKMSTQSQIDSTKEYLAWVQTSEESYKIRSEELFQQAFDFEMTALAHFNAAKMGKNP